MNNTINKLLLAGDKFMPEIHNLLKALVDHLLSINKEFKSLKNLEIQTIYIKMN